VTERNERDTCRDFVVPRLEAAGWGGKFTEQDYFTDGRIVPTGRSCHRHERKFTDYQLKHLPHVAIAVIEAKREWSDARKGLQQAMEYAEILGLPFAYATNGRGIVEHDFLTGRERDDLTTFPSPTELWARWKPGLQIPDDQALQDALHPYCRDLRDATGQVLEPRFYQRVAIDRAVQSVFRNRRRMLICMATGSGKTFVASQIVWKLWKTGRKKRILYLADRDFLVDQPYRKEFSIFGDALERIKGVARKSREIYFALYQAISDDVTGLGLYC
jgi:type I restriction enzyme R subunit